MSKEQRQKLVIPPNQHPEPGPEEDFADIGGDRCAPRLSQRPGFNPYDPDPWQGQTPQEAREELEQLDQQERQHRKQPKRPASLEPKPKIPPANRR